MSDWPGNQRGNPWVGWGQIGAISVMRTHSGLGTHYEGQSVATGAVTAAVYPQANKAFYYPFYVHETVTAYQLSVVVGASSSGNVDAGIYDEFGTRLVSVGSTACGTASTLQLFNIADTVLVPGTYYAAFVCDNTTANFVRLNTPAVQVMRTCGLQAQASAFALPATATFAAVDFAWAMALRVHLRATV